MKITPEKRALAQYRKRLSERGVARFEILARETDRELIRSLAKILASEGPESESIRSVVRGAVAGKQSSKGGILRALRRSPLVGADLRTDRPYDAARRVDL